MTARPPDPDLLAARLEPEPGIAAEPIELDADTAALVDLGRELVAAARFAPASLRQADLRRRVLRRVGQARRRRLLRPIAALALVGVVAVTFVALSQPGWGDAVGAIIDDIRRDLGIEDSRSTESPEPSDEARPSVEPPASAPPSADPSPAPASPATHTASPAGSTPGASPAPGGGTVSATPTPTPTQTASPSASAPGDPTPPVPVPTPPPPPSPPVPSEVPPSSDG